MAGNDETEPDRVDTPVVVRSVEYGGQQPVDRFVSELGLPEGFFARTGTSDPLFATATEWLTTKRPKKQNHWPALTLALIAQAEDGLFRLGEASVSDVFGTLQIEEADPSGQPVNTLNFSVPKVNDDDDPYVRLRGKYNLALSLILTRMRRNGHPSNPGHATQSWRAYRPLVELIWAMTPEGRTALVAWSWANGVLPLDETKIVAVVERPIRPFRTRTRRDADNERPTRECVARPVLWVSPGRLTKPSVGVLEGTNWEPAVRATG